MGAGKPIRMAGNSPAVNKYTKAVRSKQQQSKSLEMPQKTSVRSMDMPQNREFAYNGPDPVYDERRAKEVGPAYREAYMREINKAAQERN